MVTGDLVYAVIYDVDPDAFAENNLRRRKAKGNFTSRGPNCTGFILLMATIN